MINFIICDDNEIIRSNVISAVNKIMMKNKIAYKIHEFIDYNDTFLTFINKSDGNRIFVLDIETPSRSGIDVARIIRMKDKQSSIIFLTSHDELGYTLLKSKINFLTFISKYDDYEENVKEAVEEALKYVGVKRTLDFLDHGVEFSIPIANILYVTKDTVERKSIIKTDNNEYKIYIPLHKLKKDLGSNFRQTHRSCVINKDRTESINYNKRIITFDNGEKIDMLSDTYKKELI